ncbi:TPA: hypothetical protein ACJJWP_003474 [Enterobacter roggenkampii]
MSTITKEWLQQKIAEPVAFINGAWTLVYYRPPKELGLKIGDKLFTAPPAPVSVPDVVSWEDVPEEITEDDFSLASAWAHGFNQCRAAMLQGAEPVNKRDELPLPVRNALTQALEAMEFMGDTLNNLDAVCSEDVEQVTPAFEAVRALLAGNTPVIPDCSCHTCRPVTFADSRFVVCPVCGNKRCPHANDHRNACTGSNEPGQEGSAYPAAPQQEMK